MPLTRRSILLKKSLHAPQDFIVHASDNESTETVSQSTSPSLTSKQSRTPSKELNRRNKIPNGCHYLPKQIHRTKQYSFAKFDVVKNCDRHNVTNKDTSYKNPCDMSYDTLVKELQQIQSNCHNCSNLAKTMDNIALNFCSLDIICMAADNIPVIRDEIKHYELCQTEVNKLHNLANNFTDDVLQRRFLRILKNIKIKSF